LPGGDERSSIEPTAATLARLEKTLADIQHTLAIQFQRIADMQAELDKLGTTVRDHLAQHQGLVDSGPRAQGSADAARAKRP
jgi:hypothetical protein